MKDKKDIHTKDMFAPRKTKKITGLRVSRGGGVFEIHPITVQGLAKAIEALSGALIRHEDRQNERFAVFGRRADGLQQGANELSKSLAAHIDTTAKNLSVLQRDTKYAVENVNAIMGRVSKYGPPQGAERHAVLHALDGIIANAEGISSLVASLKRSI